jgi:predicted enzyme related to lactoylglutathione lyase
MACAHYGVRSLHRIANVTMPNQLAHFAIHADDLDRVRKFYGAPSLATLRQGTASAVPIRQTKEGGFSR